MIYTQIPLKCRFIPVNIDDEVFQLIFMCNFQFYLENVANKYMELVDNPEQQDLNDGDVVYLAQWAKDVYNNKVKIEETIDYLFSKWFVNKHKKYIIDNVDPRHIEFQFGDLSQTNVNDAINLYNAILKKV